MSIKRTLLGAALFSTVLAVPATMPAEAFKPYTHISSAQPALADVRDDGKVTIDGREYDVRDEVVAALDAWPSYYQAGVIGPDGFPDLTFGQSQIHPEQTGKWLRYLLTEAWAAQTDPAYSADERGQILAFTYGFLTHAAGDMWAHTFVNDFAHGIFPAVGEIVTDVDKAEIALRHTIVEGYIGDATGGYDGNPDRTTLPDGDVSDDSTPGIAFDAPREWIYDKLVNPHTPLPVGSCAGGDDDNDGTVDDGCPGKAFTVGDPEPARGPLIDYFLDLQSDLQLQEAVLEHDGEREDCALVDPDCYERTAHVTVDTVRGVRTGTYSYNACIGATIGCLIDPGDLADDLLIKKTMGAYLEAWVEDIEVGLQHWGDLGLATTRALFDPQALRNTQNEECEHHGGEGTQARADCEDGIGATDVVFHELDPFINDHLLSMAGAPDALGGIREALQSFSDLLDDIVGPAANPLRVATAAIKEELKQLVLEQIKESYGVDVELLSSFMKHPTYWLDVEQVQMDLGPLGNVQVDLFEPEEHERLDALLDLPADHHVNTTITLPDGSTQTSSALSDSALFNDLEIYDNSTTTAKLLLLDADELNQVAGDQLAEAGVVKSAGSVATYDDPDHRPANIMVDGLGGGTWLPTIDGDHVWRQDGLPRFGPDDHGDHDGEVHGGSGNFPLWESCLLRPSFRSLYEDWETDPAWYPELTKHEIDDPNFPALGDGTSADPSDTAAPESGATVGGGAEYVDPATGTTYVGGGSTVTVSASDEVFADGGIDLQARVFRTGEPAPAWAAAENGAALPLTGADGPYTAQTRAGDPCHAVGDATATSTEFVLDTTAPEITVTSPAPEGVVFDTDDRSTITWGAVDGPHGSGVASTSATFDGVPVAQGHEIDAFLLAPGEHTVTVTATDNLGNTSTFTRTFEVRATAESLLSNIERARAEGLITDQGAYNGLTAKLKAAVAAHNAGRHAPEVNQLGATLNQVEAKLGKGIESVFGERLVAWLEDLIAQH